MTDLWRVRQRRRVVVVAAAALLVSAACGDDGDAAPTTTLGRETTTSETTTTVPPRPPSTTTTMFDPASVEGEVEAAYLRSWDVYAEAVYNLELDEAALAEVYGEQSLQTRTEEIVERISDRRAAHVQIDHNYEIAVVDASTAAVLDSFVNHQVLIDPETKEPIEADPNEALLVNFQMKRIDGAWKVTLIQRLES